ncbi:MAG: acyl-CoA dehydrogenase family protein [Actinomycetota bacterium]|nr:acyl-CoA dehydrogenase family protein [Actinomycetota bacterium]
MPEVSEAGAAVRDEVRRFMDEHVLPNEETYYEQLAEVGIDGMPAVLEKLKSIALQRGLWNLFLPGLRPDDPGTRLTNVEYAPISELLGAVGFASEALNCSAPDTGNMEILHHYGSERVREQWLAPLLAGEIRSAFSMTEPDVASSDATNISLSIERDGDHYVLNGRKWFSSGARSPRCKVLVVMGRSNPDAPRHLQHSMVVVPRETPGVSLGMDPSVFGYDERGGHPEVVFRDARVPVDNLLGEEGGGFAIAQARLGPGRIHHCMRTIGVAERALGLMVTRSLERSTFGTSLAHKGVVQDWIAEARIEIDMCRQYVLHAAHLMDTVGNKAAAVQISGIKVAVPRMALQIVDRAIQVHGAAGVTQFTPLAHMYAGLRTLRLADGPDEVHKMSIARREIRRHHPGFTGL